MTPFFAAVQNNTFFRSLTIEDVSRKEVIPLLAKVVRHNRTLTKLSFTGVRLVAVVCVCVCVFWCACVCLCVFVSVISVREYVESIRCCGETAFFFSFFADDPSL
jgi:hypothetical protein